MIRAKEEYLCMALKNIAFEMMCWKQAELQIISFFE